MAIDEKFNEVLADLIGGQLVSSLSLAISTLLLASAEASANTMTALVRQSNDTAVVELATCARCVEEILRSRRPTPAPEPFLRAAVLSETEEIIRRNSGAPVVT